MLAIVAPLGILYPGSPFDASHGDRICNRRSRLKVSAYFLAIMLAAVALQSPPAQSQEVKAGDLVISQPWSRAAPRGADFGTSYLTIENKGTAADRLLGGSADAAEKLEVQQIGMVGGGLTAHPVEGGLAIAPGDKVVLAPGGYYLALLKLKNPLKKGSKVSIALQFEKAGKIDVAFDVLSPASKGPVAPKAADDGKMKK
jgi:copper(I)-binding protein